MTRDSGDMLRCIEMTKHVTAIGEIHRKPGDSPSIGDFAQPAHLALAARIRPRTRLLHDGTILEPVDVREERRWALRLQKTTRSAFTGDARYVRESASQRFGRCCALLRSHLPLSKRSGVPFNKRKGAERHRRCIVVPILQETHPEHMLRIDGTAADSKERGGFGNGYHPLSMKSKGGRACEYMLLEMLMRQPASGREQCPHRTRRTVHTHADAPLLSLRRSGHALLVCAVPPKKEAPRLNQQQRSLNACPTHLTGSLQDDDCRVEATIDQEKRTTTTMLPGRL